MCESNFVFGYGSLVDVENLQKDLGRDLTASSDFIFCYLKGYHRCWNIAMDNRINFPDYKYYVEKETGSRPEGFVAFLNIRPHKGSSIIGILFSVSEKDLQNLDKRERNYRRVDITNLIEMPFKGKAWVYIGFEEAEKRYQEGLAQHNIFVSQSYFNSVYNAYLSLGEDALSNYVETTDALEVPVLDLKVCVLGNNKSSITS
jgi:cation transport regulator ChaC